MNAYSYSEEHGGGHHSSHRATTNRSLSVHRDMTVAEGAPQLAGQVGKWVTHQWTGRKDEVKICNRVTFVAGEPYVHVERKYPWTGGVIAVKTLLVDIPQPRALMLRPPMAIVLYNEKAHRSGL